MADPTLHSIRTVVRPLVPRRFHAGSSRALGRVLALVLRGSAVSCPCCGARLRRFLPYPSLYCPRCGSYERHRLLALQLRRRPELLRPPLRLLQVSPDRPLEHLVSQEGIDRTSIDIDNPEAQLRMDVGRLTFESESFDAVLALHVLNEVADRLRALHEVHRVLRTGGNAILQVPVDDQPRLLADLAAAGFATEVLSAEDLGAEVLRRHGLLAAEETLIGTKP